MSTRHRPPHRLGVLTDRRTYGTDYAELFAGPQFDVVDVGTAGSAHAVSHLLDHGVETVVIAGDDRLVGEAVTARLRRLRQRSEPLCFVVADGVGPFSAVADELGVPALDAGFVERLADVAGRDAWSRRQLDTLKVSASDTPAARLGFAVGAGVFYTLLEARHRAGRSGVGRTLGQFAREMLTGAATLEPTPARVTVDRKPAADQLGYLIASTLGRSWLGLPMRGQSDPVALRLGQAPGDLAAKVARSRALPGFLRGDDGDVRPFEVVHIDWSGGYVVDGELYSPKGAYLLQIEPGPPADFLTFD